MDVRQTGKQGAHFKTNRQTCMESGLVVDQLALRCKDSEVVAPGYVSHMLVSASYIRGYLETVTDKRSVLRIQNIVHISPALSYEQ